MFLSFEHADKQTNRIYQNLKTIARRLPKLEPNEIFAEIILYMMRNLITIKFMLF